MRWEAIHTPYFISFLIKKTFRVVSLLALLGFLPLSGYAAPLEIGSRLEPMVDDYLIDTMTGMELRLNHPVARNVAITFDKPWEGNTSCYVTVFEDEDRFRMYFRGSNYNVEDGSYSTEYVCYAESEDGITWTRPELGLVEFEGSKANNILLEGIGVHNFAPFKDTNPDCKPEARYKALASGKKKGLVAFTSPDAIHWTLVSEEPVITKGAFDSQNLAFYDNVRGRYVDFHRGFKDGVRHIMTCTSEDFQNWTDPQWLDFGDTPDEHLYTNAAVAALFERGADSLTGGEGDLRIDFEMGDGGRVLNAFNQNEVIMLPGHQGPADTALSLNYATSAAGSIRCEIQDSDGKAIPGFTLAECDEIFGDDIARPVTWGGKAEVNSLVGKTVRLHFVLFDADLYSLRFQ